MKTLQQPLKERMEADVNGTADLMWNAARQGKNLRGFLAACEVVFMFLTPVSRGGKLVTSNGGGLADANS